MAPVVEVLQVLMVGSRQPTDIRWKEKRSLCCSQYTYVCGYEGNYSSTHERYPSKRTRN